MGMGLFGGGELRCAICLTWMGSLRHTVFGKCLHSFFGTYTGTSEHFLVGTDLHFVFGI